MTIYRTDIWIAATVYVAANTPEQAAEMVNKLDGIGIEIQEQWVDDGLEITGKTFDQLTGTTLSPAMSVYARKMEGSKTMWEAAKIDADDMEEAE